MPAGDQPFELRAVGGELGLGEPLAEELAGPGPEGRVGVDRLKALRGGGEEVHRRVPGAADPGMEGSLYRRARRRAIGCPNHARAGLVSPEACRRMGLEIGKGRLSTAVVHRFRKAGVQGSNP